MAGIQVLRPPLCICLLSVYLLHIVAGVASPRLGRSSFPRGFKFGAGSSAYQAEGAAHEGGKGPSIWDTFSHTPGKIADGKNGDVAVDQYHRYKEDVQLLKNMGMDVYRFSISWSRIFPKGSPRHGPVNKVGIVYYNNFINELLRNGIEPFVTLFHWDMPQALEDEYGGFRSKRVVEDFSIFAEECFRAFGDRVKYWVTVNEPLVFSLGGYDLGIHAPGRCSAGFGNCTAGNSATEPYIVTHNMLLAHSAVVKLYRTKYQGIQKGSIGIVLVVSWVVPFSKSKLDQRAARRAFDFRIGWYARVLCFSVSIWVSMNRMFSPTLLDFNPKKLSSRNRNTNVFLDYRFLDPLVLGKYPDSVRRLVKSRLPRFTAKEAKELKGSFDFLGYNYYTTQYTTSNPNPPNPLKTDFVLDARCNVSYQVNGVYIGSDEGVSDFRSYPAGLRDVINYTKHHYNNPPIYITETGYADFDNGTTPLQRALNDSGRLKYHSEHLSHLLQSIKEGADVRGYIAWSLMDSFEWSSGYNYRFGLYHVDYKDNLKRYPRSSAHWFKHILRR